MVFLFNFFFSLYPFSMFRSLHAIGYHLVFCIWSWKLFLWIICGVGLFWIGWIEGISQIMNEIDAWWWFLIFSCNFLWSIISPEEEHIDLLSWNGDHIGYFLLWYNDIVVLDGVETNYHLLLQILIGNSLLTNTWEEAVY